MSLFQRLITETQISNPPEPAMDHDLIKLMVLLPAIAIYFRSFRYETPCTYRLMEGKGSKLANFFVHFFEDVMHCEF